MKLRIFNKIIFFLIVGIIIILLIVLTIIVIPFGYPLKFKNEINYVSKKYYINPEIIAGVVFAESTFNENSVSNKGAVGLMQLMPDTANWLCIKMGILYDENMLFNSLYNLELGTYYISYLKKKFDNLNAVLAAYNAGEGNVSEWLENSQYSSNGKDLITTPFKQTNSYLQKVNNAMEYYITKF
ncbi:MAG: lytic transglycosylase domain-containing protein [Clostridia bacterium]|nr:lytic transglycosylase domain-containing protein [Clostridia bacterium]